MNLRAGYNETPSPEKSTMQEEATTIDIAVLQTEIESLKEKIDTIDKDSFSFISMIEIVYCLKDALSELHEFVNK